MMNQKIKNIGRWLAILPVATLSYILAGIIVNLFFMIQQWFMGVGSDSGLAKINYWIFSSIGSSVAAVYFGSIIAPGYRRIVALVLGALVVSVSCFGLLGAFFVDGSLTIWMVLSAVSAVIAAGYVVHYFYEEAQQYSSTSRTPEY
jgi:lipid-A-disaccharide synthase-like uncharacterized protein